jgi:transposase
METRTRFLFFLWFFQDYRRQELVRITTVFRKLLGVTKLIVQDVNFEAVGLVLHAKLSWRLPRCSGCQKRAPGYDRKPARRWRHLALGRYPIWLSYAPRRVDCPRCGVRVEEVPWAAAGSRFTYDFEEMVAYLAQVTDKTKVTELMGISWVTVGSIVERVVASRLDPERLEDLRRIGIDEFSYRKRHRYITVVVDHDRRRVIWAGEGRSAETLKGFFEELGEDCRAGIKEVTIDMAGGYIKAIESCLPEAEIIFDRFHVQRLASDAVDEVRRSMVRATEDPEEARAIKRSRFALLKNPWDLTASQSMKLSEIQQRNKRLYRAYLLKETLAKALDYLQPKRATIALNDWLAWASRSKLKPFVKTARTIRKHFFGVLAYVKTRLTNGVVEGLNNKLRMIARRAYGFHSAPPLIAMLFLSSAGIQLDPPLPGIHPLER